ncbi:helix-turn-helix domain-containing protein [Chryseobacterium sp. FH1]|uniref:helix-turn-helix domain-containing protein n=1 Tax=Chryseobacterium sp. FH1 TaxID=1233951 RepID=UPI0004E3F87C|nr:response regulator transcription factor [Chryseobacterium sp. FH1]KFC19554.1 hypothetical protein IO90_09730 [Chryseobacterium sp. FH1]
MEVNFYQPKNSILKEYIEGYYFIAEDILSKPLSYLTFPNNYCILSIYQNADEHFYGNQYKIKSAEHSNIVAGLVTSYSNPLEIIYENLVNEVTIYFKPLAINYFIDNSLLFKQSKISDFTPFPDYKEKMELIFKQSDRENQIKLLEDYLLSNFVKKDLDLVEQILADIEKDLKIDEIAQKYNFTRQHINILFSKNVGKTPSEYRKIHRFRKALINKSESKNLTTLSHQNLFFDQSHFIKDFKKLTGKKPKEFFKNVDTDKENIWLFI